MSKHVLILGFGGFSVVFTVAVVTFTMVLFLGAIVFGLVALVVVLTVDIVLCVVILFPVDIILAVESYPDAGIFLLAFDEVPLFFTVGVATFAAVLFF